MNRPFGNNDKTCNKFNKKFQIRASDFGLYAILQNPAGADQYLHHDGRLQPVCGRNGYFQSFEEISEAASAHYKREAERKLETRFRAAVGKIQTQHQARHLWRWAEEQQAADTFLKILFCSELERAAGDVAPLDNPDTLDLFQMACETIRTPEEFMYWWDWADYQDDSETFFSVLYVAAEDYLRLVSRRLAAIV